MTPERWREIEELYHAAREQGPTVLARAEPELRREVELMLAQDSVSQFLDRPAAELLETPTVTQISIGQEFGPYRVEDRLGAGGMGEVFRALDTRLDRRVAIKVAAERFSDRFGREARAIAALNHPHVCTLYDVGPNYLVMELVEGETLTARLRKGALPIELVLRYGAQIADALAAAHERGIIHRDLKPGNIMIGKTGVKVVDFGLARITPNGPAQESLTASNTIMGTVAYMSPEQLEGKPCDARSDIFSAGLILYEMATGKRAFSGDSQAAVIAEVMRCQPPAAALTPTRFAHVVSQCVARDPGNRWHAAADLKLELEWALEAEPEAPAKKPEFLQRRYLTAAMALIAGLSLSTWLLLRRAPEPQSWSGALLGGPEIALDPRVSPDGNLVAFQAYEQGYTQVAVMKPETANWSVLTHNRTGSVDAVAWSADGASIFYDREGAGRVGIYSVPVLGGDERLIVEDAQLPETLSDGSLLVAKFNAQQALQYFHFWPDTGKFQELPVITAAELGTIPRPRASPDGKFAALFGRVLGREAEGMRLLLLDLSSGVARPMLPANQVPSSWAFTRDGKFVLATVPADGIWRMVAIPVAGAAQPRALFTITNQSWYLDAGPDGNVYLSLTDRPSELERRSVRGEAPERIASFPTTAPVSLIAVLADGRTVVDLPGPAGHPRLMTIEKGKDPVPLIATTEETASPMAPAGADEIAFVIGPAPHLNIALANTVTGRITRRFSPGKGEIESLAASPDGGTLYFSANQMVWSVPSTGGAPHMIGPGEYVTASARTLVIGVADTSNLLRLLRVPLNGGSEQEIKTDGSVPFQNFPLSPGALNASGDLLLPLSDSWFNRPGLLNIATGRVTVLPSDGMSDYHTMAWLPDGRIMALHTGLRSTLWRFRLEGVGSR
jgi:hypothetical protein